MKVAICLCLAVLVGFVSTEYAWSSGEEYVYSVRGRMMQGVSVINNLHAGFEIQYKLYVKLLSPNKLAIKPENVEIVETEESLDPREGDIEKGQEIHLSAEMKAALESPILVTLKKGVPQMIQVEKNLPTTLINVKRAQVSQVIVDTVGVKIVIKGNINRNTNAVRVEDKNDDSGFFFETMEKTVHGECETYYTVSQTGPGQSVYQHEAQDQPSGQQSADSEERPTLGRYDYTRYSGNHNSASLETSSEEQQRELPWPKAFKEFCNEKDQIYEIYKVTNFTACKEKPVLSFFSPAQLLNCRPGDNNCGSIWNRALVSKILACGTSRRNFNIIQIQSNEVFNFGLRSTQKLVSVGIKNITIEKINKQGSSVHYTLKSPQTVDLVYEFDRNEQRQQINGKSTTSQRQRQQTSSSSSSEEQQQQHSHQHSSSHRQRQNKLPFPALKDAPLRPFLISPLNIAQMKERAQQLVVESAKDIHNNDRSIADQETLSKLSIAAKVLRFLAQDDLLEVYNKLTQQSADEQEQRTRKNFIVDALCMAGTNPAITAVMKLIEQQKLIGEKASQLVMTFPMYIRHPTPELLERFFQFLKHSVVEQDQQLQTTAVLAYSVLLNQACVDPNVKQSRYNIALYGEFCQVEDTDKFVEYLVQKINQALNKSGNHWTHVYLTALGNVGTKRVVSIVQKILDDSNDPIEKSKAIFALKKVVVSQGAENTPDNDDNQVDRVVDIVIDDEFVEKKVLPILVSVAFDKSEHPMVRMAAIQMLVFSSQVDIAIYQQLALLTWSEVSQEVHSFIFTTLKNLAKLHTVLRPTHWKMVSHARAVFSLCKPFEEGLFKSRNMFQSEYVDDINTGFFQQLTWYSGRDSIIPTSLYYRNYIQHGTNAFGTNPIELSFHARTISQIAEVVADQLDVSSSSEESGEKNPTIKELKSLLGIKKREMDEDAHGSVFLNIRNEMQRIVEINVKDLEKQWKSKALYVLAAIRRGVDINYQKVGQLIHHTMEMPTMFGVPVIYKQRFPVMVSTVGQAKLQGSSSDGQIHAAIEVVLSGKITQKVAAKIPYLAKKYEAGFQRHLVIDVPMRATIRLASQRPVTIAFTPTRNIDSPSASGKIELVTLHSRPYVATVEDELTPIVLSGMNLVNAEDRSPVYTNTETFGKKPFGLAFRVEEKSDYREEEETVTGWSRFIRRFHSPSCFFSLWAHGPRTVKYSYRRIILDVDESSSKTLVLAIAAKRGSSSLDGSWNTDSSSSSSSSSSSESAENTQTGNQQRRYIHGSSSSSSSSETNESSDSTENSKEVFNKARVIAIALFGKTRGIPPVRQTSSIVDNLDQQVPSQVQYLLQIAVRSNKLYIRAASADAANQAAQSLPTDSKSLQVLRDAIVKGPNAQEQQDGCMEFYTKYTAPEHANQKILTVLRQSLLSRELKVRVQGQYKLGATCSASDLKYKISWDGELNRDSDMKKWAEKDSLEAQICEEDEKKGFTVSDTCLEVANQQAAALNQWRLTFKWSKDMPNEVKNFTRQVEDLAQYVFYPYLSQNYYPKPQETSPENTIIAEFEHTPDTQFWNLMLRKPTSVLAINNVRSGRIVQTLLPLTATQTLYQNVMDYVAGNDSQPTCQFQGRYFSTFDNVVARFKPEVAQGCYQLLTADCSGDKTFAISAKNLGTQDIKLKVVLSGAKIWIGKLQSGRGITQLIKATQSQLSVLVNGQQVQLPYTIRKDQQRPQSNDHVARIRQMPNGGVQIETQRQGQISFDSEKIVIYGHEDFRNVSCGMCGDFDGEKVADFRSPHDFPLSSGSLLYASYSYKSNGDSETCHVLPEVRNKIQQEEAIGQKSYQRSLLSRSAKQASSQYNSRRSQQYDSSESSESNSQSSETQKSTRQSKIHQQYREHQSKICVSQESLKVCPFGYYPIGGEPRQAKFWCFPKNNKIAVQFTKKIRKGQHLQQVDLLSSRYQSAASESQYFTVKYNPTECRHS